MKQSTKECLIVFVLSLLLVVGSATGGYVGCTLACRDCCAAACAPKPARKCGCAMVQVGDKQLACECCGACQGSRCPDPPKCCPEK
jgi:hypothetical protein